jgi:hypothetical protein
VFWEWLGSIIVALVVAYFTLSRHFRPSPNLHGDWTLAVPREPAQLTQSVFASHRQVFFLLRNFSEVPAFNVTATLVAPHWPDDVIDSKNPFTKDDFIRVIVGMWDMEFVLDDQGHWRLTPSDLLAKPIVPIVRVTWHDAKHGDKQQVKVFRCPEDVR